jgi:nuclear pore complex protein Nup107
MTRLKNSVDADDVQIAELSQALQETIEQATEHVEALFDKEWGTLTQKSTRKSQIICALFPF